MKRWMALWIVWLSIMQAGIVQASNVPAQSGVVTDPIGLFSTEQKTMIEDHISDQLYELRVLTDTELSESEGLELANQAYDQWGLTPNQLLLVITTNDNYVHLVYDNIHLQDAIADSAAKDAKGIIDRTFVPLAQQGRIADGVIEVSKWINKLQLQEQVAGPPAEQRPPSSQENGESIQEAGEGISVWRILAPIIVVLLLFYILSRLLTGIRHRKMLRQQHQQWSEIVKQASSRLSQIVLSEMFRELELGFYKGQTKSRLDQLEQQALELQNQAESWQAKLAKFQVPRFFFTESHNELNQISKGVPPFVQQIEQLQPQLDEITAVAKQVAQKMEETRERKAAVKEELESLAARTGLPLADLRGRWGQAEQLVAQADDMDEFDPLGADATIAKADQALEQMRNSIADLEWLMTDFKRVETLAKAARRDLEERISREELRTEDDNPLSIMDQAMERLNSAERNIASGNTVQAKTDIEHVEQLTVEAKKKHTEFLHRRDESIKMIDTIEQTLNKAPHYKKMFHLEMDKVKAKYDSFHWEDDVDQQVQQYSDQLKKWLHQLRNQVQLKKYNEAFEVTVQAQQSIDHLDAWVQKGLSRFNDLEADLFDLKMRWNQQKNRMDVAWEQLRNEDVPFSRFQVVAERAGEAALVVQKIWDVVPVHLGQIESELQSLTGVIDEFVHQADQLLVSKKNVLNQMEQLYSRFHMSQSQFGGQINVSKHTKGFNQAVSNVDQLISAGDYTTAEAQIAAAYAVIMQMQNEFARKASQRNNRSDWGSGWGSGSSSSRNSSGSARRNSSSSGRSSSSSSWGSSTSSSRSSGSSGWRSGSSSGRSSGSSGWRGGGSSSGRSSGRGYGSSKW